MAVRGKGDVDAVRLRCLREGKEIRVEAAKRVRYRGSFDDIKKERRGIRAFSYELLDAGGKVLFRGTRFDPTGVAGEYLGGDPPPDERRAKKAASEKPESSAPPESPRLVRTTKREKTSAFELVVPAYPAATRLEIYSREMTRELGSAWPTRAQGFSIPPTSRPARRGAARRSSQDSAPHTEGKK